MITDLSLSIYWRHWALHGSTTPRYGWKFRTPSLVAKAMSIHRFITCGPTNKSRKAHCCGQETKNIKALYSYVPGTWYLVCNNNPSSAGTRNTEIFLDISLVRYFPRINLWGHRPRRCTRTCLSLLVIPYFYTTCWCRYVCMCGERTIKSGHVVRFRCTVRPTSVLLYGKGKQVARGRQTFPLL